MKSSFILAVVMSAAMSVALAGQSAVAQQDPQPGSSMRGMGPGQGKMGRGEGMGRGMMMGEGMGGPMMHGMMGGGCPMMGMMAGEDGESYAKGRAAFLKAELGIKGDRETAFQAYAAALEDNAQSVRSMRESMRQMMSAATPVERLNAHLETMEKRIEALRAIKPKLEAFYASLDEEQKKKANRILSGMACMM